MKNKSYSVIVVSDATSTNKEFVISSKLIRNSILAFSILLLIFGFVIFDYLTMSFDKEKMKSLEEENIRKEKTITELSANIKKINESLAKMKILKDRILVIAGLTSPYALKEVGSGGPISNISTDIEFPNNNANMINRQPKENLIAKTKDITSDADKIEKSLQFVKDHLIEQKIRLAHTPAVWPTKGYLTDGFGWRINPLTLKKHFHSAQDISTQLGNPIIATADGYILIAENIGVLGNLIHIDHGFGYQTRYGHLATLNVKEGDRVKRGQVIGYVGNTGRSTAPHLHYEVIYMGNRVNPLDFILD